jgi:hypothetical protein
MQNLNYRREREAPDELDRLGLAEARDRVFVRYLYLREGPKLFWNRVGDAVDRNDDRCAQIRALRAALWLEWAALEPWTGTKRPNLARIAEALIRRWGAEGVEASGGSAWSRSWLRRL